MTPFLLDDRLLIETLETHLGVSLDDLALAEVNAADLGEWRRWGVPWAVADRLAVRLGTTVWNVWGDEWTQMCDAYEHDDVCCEGVR
jgi:hypothetical protein